jgi:hypothetical protein
MAAWNSITLKFDPFEDLKPPLKSILSALEAVEAVLEALLALIQPFLLDLLNPIKALIQLLLAAIRAIINQIRSSGFSFLLVHPDFSLSDFSAVIYSVNGAYPKFENKVIGKFFDTSDIFRPQYPPGSSVAMLVFYIGADSPGDLLGQLLALIAFINGPSPIPGLPAPVNLKVSPVTKGGDSIAQFKNLFDSELSKSLSVEWSMPTGASARNAPGFINQIMSVYDSFVFPNFIVERSQKPGGVPVTKKVNTESIGKAIDNRQAALFGIQVNNQTSVKESSGTLYKHFSKRIPVSGSDLVRGGLTGTYKFLDDGEDLVPGETWYYRVRAYFGTPTEYLNPSNDFPQVIAENTSLIKQDRSQWIINYGSGVTMGRPSGVVKAFVPLDADTDDAKFNVYEAAQNSIMAGILLNFDFPVANALDTKERINQKTGWGTLSRLSAQLASFKSGSVTDIPVIGPVLETGSNSTELKNNFLVKAAIRRVANSTLTEIYSKPELKHILRIKYNEGAHNIISKVLNAKLTWSFIGIFSGINSDSNEEINSYLSKEESYPSGINASTPLMVAGPSPLSAFSVDDRKILAEFINTLLIPIGDIGYLSWYSVTVGDLFPSFVPYIFDFENWIKGLLKAVEGALKELKDVIQAILQRIRILEQAIKTILAIIDLLNISVRVSVLTTSSTNGSAASLVQELQSSTDKPAASPFGLHSGMVLTAGGPGQGFVAAINAIKFIVGLPFSG